VKLTLFGSNSLNFVEFNTTGDNDNYIRCDEESKFLETEIFNLFIDCFEQSNQLYDYFEPTKFNARGIIPLMNEFNRKIEELGELSSEQEFHSYIGKLFLGKEFLASLDHNFSEWKKEWDIFRDKLQDICYDVINLINHCIEEDLILWVIGY
jgi:hypothetical protein